MARVLFIFLSPASPQHRGLCGEEWRHWNEMFALFPAAIFVFLGGAQIWRPHIFIYNTLFKNNKHCYWGKGNPEVNPISRISPLVSPINLLHILKNNSAAENCTDVRLGQVVNLSIFYNIWNSWLQTFHDFEISFRWRDSENHQWRGTRKEGHKKLPGLW